MDAGVGQTGVGTLAVVGVGLIGGSIAAAARRFGAARRIIGVGRSAARLDAAVAAGLIDLGTTDLATAAREADLMVFCTPVSEIAAQVQQAAAALKAGALMTDAGSVKGTLCAELAGVRAFVGAHPIAGKERSGFEHADAELFVDRLCVLTPLPRHTMEQRTRLQHFWETLGMRTATMTPDDHDAVLARTSHVPHVVAAAVAAALPPSDRPYTGTGFRSTTRIAAGPADLWVGILAENAPAVVAALAEVQAKLAEFAAALQPPQPATLKMLLEAAKTTRESLEE